MSRRVRLRRALAGLLTLCLVATAVVAFSRPDTLAGVVAGTSLPSGLSPADRAAATDGGSAKPAPSTRPPNAESDRSKPAAQKQKAAVPDRVSGRLRAVPVPGMPRAGAGRKVTFSLEIEQGLGADKRAVARTVRSVLTDPRGWQKEDHVHFVHVTPRQQARGRHVDIRITLASPKLTDKLCAPLRTESRLDCYQRSRAVLNDRNWQHGIKAYRGDLAGYRAYLINHEVGHGLGFGHAHCHTKGTPAQVMIQQTISLEGCTPWPWPTRPKG